MKLTFQQIQQAAHGVDRCESTENGIRFHRFSEAQEEMYRREEPEFNAKLFATAGVSLRFRTDSRRLTLCIRAEEGSTRTYFAHDVFADDEYVGSLCNFTEEEMTGKYPAKSFPLGDFRGEFHLGAEEKNVTILFPALVASLLTALELDDGASFAPAEERGVYLAIGDSITHGYDSPFPRDCYPARIARKYDLYEHNLAIGGEIFRPELAELVKDEKPALVTVAYGTNDWNTLYYEQARENCLGFFDRLTRRLPDSTIYVISPVWRKDLHLKKKFGDFFGESKLIREICAGFDRLVFVDAFDFVPHLGRMFGDGFLHPNREGFSHYAEHFCSAYEGLRRG